METTILAYCKIKNNTIVVNGNSVFESNPEEGLTDFLASCYKKIEMSYPKFFKMDRLCKLGVIAMEFIAKNTPGFHEFPKQSMALVFANNASSLDSDRNHLKAITNKQHYFPSPSVFVYTLPNIVIGEIAIRHQITGENAFFVSEKFDPKLLHVYSTLLLSEENTSSVICGWVNVDADDAEAFVYCVKSLNFKADNGFQKIHTPQNIQQLYNL